MEALGGRLLVAGGHRPDEGSLRRGARDLAIRGRQGGAGQRALQLLVLVRGRPASGTGPEGRRPGRSGYAAQAEALALYEELGDLRGQANALWGMGNRGVLPAGRRERARRHFASALERFRAVGDVTMEAWSLHMLGSAVLRLGERDESAADPARSHAPLLRRQRRVGHGAGLRRPVGPGDRRRGSPAGRPLAAAPHGG